MAIGNCWTTEEVADYLGVTPGRVRQFVYESRLKVAQKIGQVLFFDQTEVRDFSQKPRQIGRPKEQNKSA